MRLIDADELPEVDTIERVDGERDVFVSSWIPSAAILKAPTVNAIPIDWLKKHGSHLVTMPKRKFDSSNMAFLFTLIKDWEDENDKKTD